MRSPFRVQVSHRYLPLATPSDTQRLYNTTMDGTSIEMILKCLKSSPFIDV
jgi:hypothetical protein